MLKTYYSDRLDGNLYSAYQLMDDAIRNRRRDCVLYGVSEADARRVVSAYTAENADVYYCALQFVRAIGSSRELTLQLRYFDNCDEEKFNRCFNQIIDKIDSKIDNYTPDYEIAKLAYEHLAETVSAADEAQTAFLRLDQNDPAATASFLNKYGRAFCAYGAIVEKKAVCMGVAMAYKMLLDHYRVDAACVTGKYDKLPHMVNVVELDGTRFYVDITKGLTTKEMPMVRYDMFLVSTARIKKYFVPDEDFGCVEEKQDYFYRNHLIFQDAASLRKYLSSCSYQRVDGKFQFRYIGGKLDDDALEKMLGEILEPRCGTEYEISGYIVENSVGNCLMKKRED